MFRKFLTTVVPSVLKPLRVLWNELLGTLFLAFAVMLIRPTWVAWRDFGEDPKHFWTLVLGLPFLLMMAGFGIHAFWRARRINRT